MSDKVWEHVKLCGMVYNLLINLGKDEENAVTGIFSDRTNELVKELRRYVEKELRSAAGYP